MHRWSIRATFSFSVYFSFYFFFLLFSNWKCWLDIYICTYDTYSKYIKIILRYCHSSIFGNRVQRHRKQSIFFYLLCVRDNREEEEEKKNRWCLLFCCVVKRDYIKCIAATWRISRMARNGDVGTSMETIKTAEERELVLCCITWSTFAFSRVRCLCDQLGSIPIYWLDRWTCDRYLPNEHEQWSWGACDTV